MPGAAAARDGRRLTETPAETVDVADHETACRRARSVRCPRVTTFRRASSNITPSSSSTSASTSVRSWPWACTFERCRGRRSSGRPRGRDRRRQSPRSTSSTGASASAATASASTSPAARLATGSRLARGPRRRARSGTPDSTSSNARRWPSGFQAIPGGEPNATTHDAGREERQPRPGPAEGREARGSGRGRAPAAEPVPPHRPRLRVVALPAPARRPARARGSTPGMRSPSASSRGSIAGGWRSVAHAAQSSFDMKTAVSA